ncbi:MAG: efflux RND transporter periplasmic adaptor subunit [Saprospiraceae bacterium]|nr:efflux RND transporter periplasmic adaptor subunit [Saprospiraceae bacterium]
MSESIQYPATLKAFDESNIYSQTTGILSSLNIELGQYVKQGQVVGKIDTRILEINLKNAMVNLETTLVNKQSAANNLKKLDEDYVRAKNLFENQAGLEVNMINAKYAYDNAKLSFENTKNSYENALVQIELTKQQIANANIVAPLSGTISAKNIKRGEYINPGVIIASITNISNVKATVFVEQSVVYKLKLNQTSILTSSFMPNRRFSGTIIYISPKADANHNYQVDLLLKNTDVALKAGTDMMASFGSSETGNVLQIPKNALVAEKDEFFVYVIENNQAVGKPIQIGNILNGKVEVLSGLKEGDNVITNGQINIKEGSIVTVLN